MQKKLFFSKEKRKLPFQKERKNVCLKGKRKLFYRKTKGRIHSKRKGILFMMEKLFKKRAKLSFRKK